MATEKKPKRGKRLRFKCIAGALAISAVIAVPVGASILPTGGEFYGFGTGGFAGGTIPSTGGGLRDVLGGTIPSTGGGLGGIFGDLGLGNILGDLGLGGIFGDGGLGGIFESVLGESLGGLGIPPEVMDVVMGKTGIEEALRDVFGDILGDINVGDIFGGGVIGETGAGGSVMGSQGIPDTGDLLDKLRAAQASASGNRQVPDIYPGKPNTSVPTLPDINIPKIPLPGGTHLPTTGSGGADGAAIATSAVSTPFSNMALLQPIQANAILAEAVTARGLSKEGQDITAARNKAGDAMTEVSEKIGTASGRLAEARAEAAKAMSPVIKEQTSTQSTLKEALAGMNELQAQDTALSAMANQQNALGLKLGAVDVRVGQEARDGVYTNIRVSQQINEQIYRDYQRQLTDHTAAYQQLSQNVRQISTIR